MTNSKLMTEISKVSTLTELNELHNWIRSCKMNLARTTLVVGSNVWVVQKTKRTAGVVTKIKLKKAIVDMNGSSYNVPMSMLELA